MRWKWERRIRQPLDIAVERLSFAVAATQYQVFASRLDHKKLAPQTPTLAKFPLSSIMVNNDTNTLMKSSLSSQQML